MAVVAVVAVVTVEAVREGVSTAATSDAETSPLLGRAAAAEGERGSGRARGCDHVASRGELGFAAPDSCVCCPTTVRGKGALGAMAGA